MGFFDALRRLSDVGRDDRGDRGDPRLSETGGMDDSAHPEYPDGRVVAADPAEIAAPPRTVDYDRLQWRRKLKRILERLPRSEPEWADLMAEAGALALEPEWTERCLREEFALLVRQAVVDRVVTLDEHRKLEQARELIGLPDAEAEAMLESTLAEAKEFFGE